MRKLLTALVAFLFISTSVMAKNNPVTGIWLLTKVEENGTFTDVYSEINFKGNGSIAMDERDFGTWSYDAKAKTVSIESQMIKEFAGTRKISELDKNKMTLDSKGTKLFFIKIDKEKIKRDNQKSGLIGVWKMNDNGSTVYLKFAAPDTLKILSVDSGSSSRGQGRWIYDKDNKTIIMMIRDRWLRGNSKIKSLDNSQFVLEKDGKELKAQKIKQNTGTLEKLDFTLDDIYESLNNDQTSATLDGAKFSWLNREAKTSYLKKVKKLKYKHSFLLADFNAFVTEELTANVSFDENSNQVTVDKIFGSISAEEDEEDNPFYPVREPEDYRVTADKVITVPAGTFRCKVVESADGFGDRKTRYYMIANRPGVYAKIIVIEKQFNDEKYEMYELTDIEGDFNKQENKQIIGNWLLVKTKTSDKISNMSTEFDFIDDGRLSIDHTVSGDFFYWNFNKDDNTVSLDFKDRVQKLNIAKLDNNEMELQNKQLTYYFAKLQDQHSAAKNENLQIAGYWMLTNTNERYEIVRLSEDHSVFDIDYILSTPIEENASQYRGKWLYNSADSTLVFKTDDHQSLLIGRYKLEKLDDTEFILSQGKGKFYFIKIEPGLITKNNRESGLEGLWKIKQSDGKYKYYEFKTPYQFKYGSAKDNMNNLGLWFYNPDTKKLFIGAEILQLEGFSKIDQIKEDTIKFENGLVATRVK